MRLRVIMNRYKPYFKSTLKFKKLLEWIEDITANDDLMYDELKVIYEWEYKYSKIKEKETVANEKKVNNILKTIKIRLKPILDSVTSKLEEVFSDWLSKHALTSAKTWATARVNEVMEYSDYSEVIGGAKYEYERYGGSKDNFYEKLFIVSFDELKDAVYEIKESYIDNENYELENETDQGIIDDIKERIESLENYDVTNNPQEALEFIETYSGGYAQDFIENNINEEICIIAYEKVVFPLWFKHWQKEGIVQTRKRVEKTFKDLKKSKKEQDIQKRIMTINIALNESHQTGSMMDYVENRWDISQSQLDQLSDIDMSEIKKWEKEIGMYV